MKGVGPPDYLTHPVDGVRMRMCDFFKETQDKTRTGSVEFLGGVAAGYSFGSVIRWYLMVDGGVFMLSDPSTVIKLREKFLGGYFSYLWYLYVRRGKVTRIVNQYLRMKNISVVDYMYKRYNHVFDQGEPHKLHPLDVGSHTEIHRVQDMEVYNYVAKELGFGSLTIPSSGMFIFRSRRRISRYWYLKFCSYMIEGNLGCDRIDHWRRYSEVIFELVGT
jgi:hypothetical protein